MNHPWPSRSPDPSPLDYWFWGAAVQEVRTAQPATVEEVKEFTSIVDEFAISLQPVEIRKCNSQSLYISKWSLFRVTAKQTQKSSGRFNLNIIK